MRNINDDGINFTNRMEHEESKKNILFYLYLSLFIDRIFQSKFQRNNKQ